MSPPGEIHLKGLAVSEGYAVARVCLFNEARHNRLPNYPVRKGDLDRQLARILKAYKIAGERLESVRARVEEKIGAAEAEIFAAQKMILTDSILQKRISDMVIRDLINAEVAVARILDEYESQVLRLDDEYLRDRASDFGEVKRRLLDVLANIEPSLECAGDEHCQRGKNRVVVAAELTPSMTVDLDTDHVMGFVTERGGVNSHAAILARALGIPAVSAVSGIRGMVECGAELLVNGNTGQVIIHPTERAITSMRSSEKTAMRMPKPVDPVEGFKVMANINSAQDIHEAVTMKAEGVGLYRTEIEVIACKRLLSEDELCERYSLVVKAMAGKSVVFRVFDLGSDKSLPSVEMPEEDNPSLGWRGTRLLLGRMDLLRTQARAIARASRLGPALVMYPMIVDAEQFMAVKSAFLGAVSDLPCGEIRHGIMFEVPSACLQAAEMFEVADFGSIGTNDLIQYLFAVDRNNEAVAYDYRPDREILWRLMGGVVSAAKAAGKQLSICGEVAAELKYIPRLVELGVGAVSVNIRRIPTVRQAAAAARRNKEIKSGRDDAL